MIINLEDSAPVNLAKPSIDKLFSTAASALSEGAVCVILSGTGRDGIEGVKKLKEKGCVSIVQDKETAPVYGMPEKIISAGCADEILPDAKIGDRIVEIVRSK